MNNIYDLDKTLDTFAHYSDPRFYSGETKTIFGKEEEGLFYNYDDRLVEWDAELEKASRKAADVSTNNASNTGKWFQEYLSNYYKHEVELRHILIEVNVSNGFSYLVFGTRNVNERT